MFVQARGVRVLLAMIVLLQASGLSGLVAAREACARHEGAVMAQSHEHEAPPPGDSRARDEPCDHCPPQDCLQHAACNGVAAAVVSAGSAARSHAEIRVDFGAASTPSAGPAHAPPITPPRLIA